MRYAFGLMGLAALAVASDVHDLTEETFAPFVKDNSLVLAECKDTSSTPTTCISLTITCSLRPMVWPLQSPRARVRGRRDDAEGEEHCLGQDRLHGAGGSMQRVRR